jgi:SAM-dependent methyltransferase
MTEEEIQLQKDLGAVNMMIYGNWLQQVTYVFAELKIADSLLNIDKTSKELAQDLSLVESYLIRYLRCALELGYLTFDNDSRKYKLSPKGAILSSTHPQSKMEEARLNGADYRYMPWSNLIHILRNGMDESYSPTIKDGSLDYLQDKPVQLATFHAAMEEIWNVEDDSILEKYDFKGFKTIMDIGCGTGTFIQAILKKNSNLNGIMFDIPGTFEGLEVESLDERLIMLSGNFFESIPDTADLYVMKNVVHNWREFKVKNLLQSAHKAMSSTSGITTKPENKRLLIIENLVPDDGTSHKVNWMDLNFLILIDGAERTLKEYELLGEECGFKLIETYPTDSGRFILEYALI